MNSTFLSDLRRPSSVDHATPADELAVARAIGLAIAISAIGLSICHLTVLAWMPEAHLRFISGLMSHDGEISHIGFANGLVVAVLVLVAFMARPIGRDLVQLAVLLRGDPTTRLLWSLFLVYLGLRMLWPHKVEEDSFFENMTAVNAFLAGGLFAVARDHARMARLALAVLAILFALEEISWGQRLIGIETREFLAVVNKQDEINLHNLVIGDMLDHSLYAGFFFSLWVIAHVAEWLPFGFSTLFLTLRHRALTLLPLAMIAVYGLLRSGEIVEELFSIMLLVWAFLAWRGSKVPATSVMAHVSR